MKNASSPLRSFFESQALRWRTGKEIITLANSCQPASPYR
jgi:hypothetical protein